MTDPTFETRLTGQVRTYAEAGVRPIDRFAIAERTVASGRTAPRWRHGSTFRPVGANRILIPLLVGLLLAALVGGAVMVGGRRLAPSLLTPTAPPSAPASPPASLPVVIANPSALPTQVPAVIAPPVTVRSSFQAPLSLTLSRTWSLVEDTPTEVQIEGEIGPSGARYGTTDITIGIPYGAQSALAFVRSLKTLRYPPADANMHVDQWCPGMLEWKAAKLVGLSGYEFDCGSDASIDFIPIYPKSRQAALAGVPASLDAASNWYVIRKGGPYLRFFVADVGRTTIIVDLAMPYPSGPKPVIPASLDALKALNIRFGQ